MNPTIRQAIARIDVLQADQSASRGAATAADRRRASSRGGVVDEHVQREARYSFTSSSDPATLLLGPGGVSASQELSFVPRHLFAVGAAWVSPRRIYFSAQAIHRSQRFGDVYDDGTDLRRDLRHPDWTARVAGGWESLDKHWPLEFAAFDLLSKQAPSTYQLSAKFRR